MINIDDTRTLLGVVERSFKPTTTLIDTFFPEEKTFITEYVEMEYRKGARRMAPFVVPGTKGVNLARTGTNVRTYKAPLMKPKRVTEASDIMRRGFGETVYSQRTPAERAQEMRARDMAELIESCVRRQEWMAAQVLINGSCRLKVLPTMVKQKSLILYLLILITKLPSAVRLIHGMQLLRLTRLAILVTPLKLSAATLGLILLLPFVL